MAVATVPTGADGVARHGLAYVPTYCQHVQYGKVGGQAAPVLEQPCPGVVTVDAVTGFAHSPIAARFEALTPAARTQGVAALAARNSYNCGVLGYHMHRLAQAGLAGLGFLNAPASIASSGRFKPIVRTNPFSIAAPGSDGQPAILIDQSEVMKHALEGKPILIGWALIADGNRTTDPEVDAKVSMAPSGGNTGVGVAVRVQLIAAAPTGATLGINASPFSGTLGGPKTGQFFTAIDPGATANGWFTAGMSVLVEAIRAQEGAHLPGHGCAFRRCGGQYGNSG